MDTMMRFDNDQLNEFLTKEEVKRRCPVAFIESPTNPNLSTKYVQANTETVIDDLEKLGWRPVEAKQKKTRAGSIYSFHMIAFQNPEVKVVKVNDDGKTVAAVDLEVPGAGELIGGSQREEKLDVLLKRMEELGMEEEGMEEDYFAVNEEFDLNIETINPKILKIKRTSLRGLFYYQPNSTLLTMPSSLSCLPEMGAGVFLSSAAYAASSSRLVSPATIFAPIPLLKLE